MEVCLQSYIFIPICTKFVTRDVQNNVLILCESHETGRLKTVRRHRALHFQSWQNLLGNQNVP